MPMMFTREREAVHAKRLTSPRATFDARLDRAVTRRAQRLQVACIEKQLTIAAMRHDMVGNGGGTRDAAREAVGTQGLAA